MCLGHSSIHVRNLSTSAIVYSHCGLPTILRHTLVLGSIVICKYAHPYFTVVKNLCAENQVKEVVYGSTILVSISVVYRIASAKNSSDKGVQMERLM